MIIPLKKQYPNLRILKVKWNHYYTNWKERRKHIFYTRKESETYFKLLRKKYLWGISLKVISPVDDVLAGTDIIAYFMDAQTSFHRPYTKIIGNPTMIEKEYYILFTGEEISANYIHADDVRIGEFVSADTIHLPGYILAGIATLKNRAVPDQLGSYPQELK